MSSCNGGSGGSPMGGKGSCSDVEVLHSHAVFECTSPISQTYSGHFSLCSLNSCTHRIKAFLNVTCPQVTFFIYWGSNAFFLLWLRISNCGFNNKVFAYLITKKKIPIFRNLLCLLVELIGIEPMTPCVQGRCSPSWAKTPFLECLHNISCRGSSCQ